MIRRILSDYADYLARDYEQPGAVNPLRRLWWRFECRWLLTAPACAIKGHDWQDQHVCIAKGATACARCGRFRGIYGKDNGREACMRTVIVKPGLARVEVAKYPPLREGEWLPGNPPEPLP